MSAYLEDTKLAMVSRSEGVTLYRLEAPRLLNKYFVTSYEGSRRLLMQPEEVGYQTYLDTMPPTVEALKYFKRHGLSDSVDILTILRGGLNYSVEESCFKAGIQVDNINFLSCERIIKNKEIVRQEDEKQKARNEKQKDYITRYCYSDEERVKAISELGPDPEITRFKGLGEINPDEFAGFIGPDIRLEQVTLRQEDQVQHLLEYYMGKNTTERQNFIINNLVIEEDIPEEEYE